MAIYDYLPRYYQIEVNNLKALLPGFMVAQMPFKANDDLLQAKFNVLGSSDATVGKKVANGHICTISKDGLKKVESADDVLFITYNEPLMTLFPAHNMYATDLDEEHVRAVQLIPGDEWMSDMDVLDANYPGSALLAGRIEKVLTTDGLGASDDFFACTTLPDGTPAFHYVFIK